MAIKIEDSSYEDSLAIAPIKKIFTLVKISELQYLKELQSGRLFMRPLKFFRELESKADKERPDAAEGATSVFQADKIKLSVQKDGRFIELPLVNQLYMRENRVDERIYVFCLYAIHTGPFHDQIIEDTSAYLEFLKIDPKLKAFGSNILYFKDPETFMRRVLAKFEKENMSVRLSPVEYYDLEKMHGRIPLDKIGFCKPKQFSHQNEYRIATVTRKHIGKSLVIDIGDLSDISEITTIEEFNSSVRLDFQESENSRKVYSGVAPIKTDRSAS